jgi:APA family basic amino acid/polyamine antiporter
LSRATLPRRLGLASAIAVVVGSTIGSGIFRSPAAIADRLPGPGPLMAVWVTGGLFALCGALTLAEVASALPRTGGIYAFLKQAWGPLPAFLFGWAELVVIRAAATGAIALTFAEYLFRLLGLPLTPPHDAHAHYAAAGAIVVVAGVNIVGVRFGAALQTVTTIAKYGALLLVVVLALAVELPRGGAAHLAAPGGFALGPFGLALVSVLWAFDGWADLSFVAGEVRDPGRTLPRALIGGTLAVIVIYLAANVAYLVVVPIDELRRSPLIAAEVGGRILGGAGVVLVSVAVVVSTFGTLNGVLLTTPRIFFAMAEDGLLFRPLAAVHPRFQTPYVAIGLGAVLGVAFVLLRTFEQLADAFVVAITPFYALGVAAVFRLRRRAEHAPTFRVPGYPVTPALFVAAALYLLVNAVADASSRWPTIAVLAVVAAGVPVYYFSSARRSSRPRRRSPSG